MALEHVTLDHMWNQFKFKVEDLFFSGYHLPTSMHVLAVHTVEEKLQSWKSKIADEFTPADYDQAKRVLLDNESRETVSEITDLNPPEVGEEVILLGAKVEEMEETDEQVIHDHDKHQLWQESTQQYDPSVNSPIVITRKSHDLETQYVTSTLASQLTSSLAKDGAGDDEPTTIIITGDSDDLLQDAQVLLEVLYDNANASTPISSHGLQVQHAYNTGVEIKNLVENEQGMVTEIHLGTDQVMGMQNNKMAEVAATVTQMVNPVVSKTVTPAVAESVTSGVRRSVTQAVASTAGPIVIRNIPQSVAKPVPPIVGRVIGSTFTAVTRNVPPTIARPCTPVVSRAVSQPVLSSVTQAVPRTVMHNVNPVVSQHVSQTVPSAATPTVTKTVAPTVKLEQSVAEGDENVEEKSHNLEDLKQKDTSKRTPSRKSARTGKRKSSPKSPKKSHKENQTMTEGAAFKKQKTEASVTEGAVFKKPNKEATVTEDGQNLACSLCDKICISVGSLRQHMLYHADPKKCEFCEKVFRTSKGYDMHMKVHEGKGLQCPQCLYTTGSKQYLSNHIKVVHGKKKDPTHICDLCGKSFTKNNRLQRHKELVHSDAPHECPYCSLKVKSSMTLRVHIANIHAKKDLFQCNICGVALKYRQSLIDHQKRHAGTKNQPCPHCSFMGATESDVRNHIKNKHVEPKQICDLCGKMFISPAKLRRHKVVHSGEKNFSCQHCGYLCNLKTNLYKHIRTVHNMQTENQKITVLKLDSLKLEEEVELTSSIELEYGHLPTF